MSNSWKGQAKQVPEETKFRIGLQEEPLEIADYLPSVSDDAHGALTIFVGKVRNHDPEAGETNVEHIEYVAHPEAAGILQKEVTEVILEAYPDAGQPNRAPRIVAIHRVGRLEVGDTALLVMVSSSHRYPGINLVPTIVERIKATVPVWKKQGLADGSEKWSNLP